MTQPMIDGVQVLDHPLIRHKLSFLRKRDTPVAEFRSLVRELSLLLAYEAMRDVPLKMKTVSFTNGHSMAVERLDGHAVCLIPILRAGCGLLDGMLDLVPSACVGHIGLQRNHETLEAEEYYFKVPNHLEARHCVVLDPMLATGHSAVAAITRLKRAGAQRIIFAALVAAPEGVRCLKHAHPNVPIVTCALDEGLDQHGYIVPGLGDAGDRFFGT